MLGQKNNYISLPIKLVKKYFRDDFLKGFALVELLVAIAIFAIVITVVYTTFYTGIKAYHKAQAQLRLNQEINQILDKLSIELRNCYDEEYDEEEDAGGFIGEAQSLSFFTIQNVYSQGSIKKLLARITYSFSEEKLFKKIQLDENTFLDESGFNLEELISDIKELSFQYLYFKKTFLEGEYPYEWKSQWTDKSLVPEGVKIEITRYDAESDNSVSLKRNILLRQGEIGVQ